MYMCFVSHAMENLITSYDEHVCHECILSCVIYSMNFPIQTWRGTVLFRWWGSIVRVRLVHVKCTIDRCYSEQLTTASHLNYRICLDWKVNSPAFKIHLLCLSAHAPKAYGSRFVCQSFCMSVTPFSQRSL